jgi:hypothetical protein
MHTGIISVFLVISADLKIDLQICWTHEILQVDAG